MNCVCGHPESGHAVRWVDGELLQVGACNVCRICMGFREQVPAPELNCGHPSSRWPWCDACPQPTSKRIRLERLRQAVRARSATCCEWPGCDQPGAELAHLEHRGMGGRPSADWIGNVAWLCHRHHDVLDGRTALGTLRVELNDLLRWTIEQTGAVR